MHEMAKSLWPYNRSITGEGVRQTLCHLKGELPDLIIHEIQTGTKVFDWEIPKEWLVRSAHIVTPSGKIICDVNSNNLHLVGYSRPFNGFVDLEELQTHLYSLPDQPNAIPYVTSYYKDDWGFCIADEERKNLEPGFYHPVIDTELIEGSLTFGELVIPGETEKEIFLSTYVCHPSMANNELSGPVVATFLAKWIQSLHKRNYTYRIVYVPETIGSIAYISLNMQNLKKNVVAGYNITCVGDDRCYSYLPSRNGNTLSDIVAKHVLKWKCINYKSYDWRERGSDERQYCSPNVDLPIASIMRSKFGEYPEYHTSLDDLNTVVTPAGLAGGYEVLKLAIEAIERNFIPIAVNYCEPQLGKRGMYPLVSQKTKYKKSLITEILTWADGEHSLLDIAELCDEPIWNMYEVVEKLLDVNLIKVSK